MEHISNTELRAFLKRHLPPDRLLEVDDHLAACPACRASLESEAQIVPALAGMQAYFGVTQAHLEYEQLLSLAEGQRVPAELEHHATICSSCAHEVEDLRGFVAETTQASRSFRVIQPVVPRGRVLGWRQRLIWS